jgi:hypothetical protein
MLGLLLLVAAPAAAQDDAPPAGYDHTIDQAVTEFGSGHWAEARALFLSAHALYPNARTLRGIGMSSFELRDYTEAVRTLEEALASTRRALTDEQRGQVTELLGRARAFVGRYAVPAAPAGARFYLDGEHVEVPEGWPASAGHVLLALGEHQVAIRLDDGRSTTARVTVRGNTDTTLDIDLAPLAPQTTTPPPSYVASPSGGASATVPPAPSGPDATPWIVAGVGGGVAVVGAILLGVGYADIASVENAIPYTPWPSVSGAYSRAPIETGVGAAALGVGLATGLVGVIWGAVASGSGESSSHAPERMVRVRPWGLGVEGSF